MLFPTIDFAIFFAAVFTASWLLNPYPGPWKLFMVAASYFFYAWADWRFVFLLMASTVIAFVGGAVIYRLQGRPRRIALWCALAGLLGLLAWFKYYVFVTVNVDNLVHGIDLGQPLVNDLAGTGVVTATLDGKVDTGLARPDYFNWPQELAADLANDRPQLVVVMMGANDPQSMMVGGTAVAFGTPAWNTEYASRVGAFMDAAIASGAHVLWVGMPPMASAQLNGEMNVINGIMQAQAAARPGDVTYLDSKPVLGDSQGNFTPYLTNSGGAELNIRTPDGIHLTPDGGEVLSQAVINAVRTTLHVNLPG